MIEIPLGIKDTAKTGGFGIDESKLSTTNYSTTVTPPQFTLEIGTMEGKLVYDRSTVTITITILQ